MRDDDYSGDRDDDEEAARRRMRSVGVALGVTALAAVVIVAVSNADDEVCYDETTNEEVSDVYCEDSRYGGTYVWYSGNRRVPSGSRSGSTGSGSYSSDTDGSSRYGGSTDYGGFGGRSGGVSG